MYIRSRYKNGIEYFVLLSMIVHFLLFSVNLEIFGKKEEKTIFLNVQLDIDSSDITNDNNKIISNVNSNSESKSENLRSKETLAKISSNDLEKEEKAKLKIAELKEEAELLIKEAKEIFKENNKNQKSNSSNNLLEGSDDFNAIYKSILDSNEKDSFKAVKKEYSEYVKSWQTRIEKYGTSFFPEELTDANIYGNVTMTVKINKLGEIISVKIINSSGYKVLDNVAKKVLFSVGEYEPFPRNLAIHADTISISRIWSFKKKSININEYE